MLFDVGMRLMNEMFLSQRVGTFSTVTGSSALETPHPPPPPFQYLGRY